MVAQVVHAVVVLHSHELRSVVSHNLQLGLVSFLTSPPLLLPSLNVGLKRFGFVDLEKEVI